MGVEILVYGFIGGFIAMGLSTIARRKANLMTRALNISLLSYLMPAFSLIWPFGFFAGWGCERRVAYDRRWR